MAWSCCCPKIPKLLADSNHECLESLTRAELIENTRVLLPIDGGVAGQINEHWACRSALLFRCRVCCSPAGMMVACAPQLKKQKATIPLS